ncbi:hypothetical protein IFM89_011938 [Coptis chinensis]|uniref:Transposase MuDR plant domain-containing protein n=1 Tax=Coptis chinensis TaxID=261450 RepID=A0A835H2E1_9MAGN|nr:hypothetical protein IFM89_011938 [Coptis chinensis]
MPLAGAHGRPVIVDDMLFALGLQTSAVLKCLWSTVWRRQQGSFLHGPDMTVILGAEIALRNHRLFSFFREAMHMPGYDCLHNQQGHDCLLHAVVYGTDSYMMEDVLYIYDCLELDIFKGKGLWPMRKIHYEGREFNQDSEYWSPKDYVNGRDFILENCDGNTFCFYTMLSMLKKYLPNPFKYEIEIGDDPVYCLRGARFDIKDDHNCRQFIIDSDVDEGGFLNLFMDFVCVPPKHSNLGSGEVFTVLNEDVYGEHELPEQMVPIKTVEEPQYGMDWPTIKDYRKYLRKYAILNQFEYSYTKNDGNIIRVRCKGKDCTWSFYAYVPTGNVGDGFTCKLLRLVKVLKSLRTLCVIQISLPRNLRKNMCSDYLTVEAYRRTYENGVRPFPNACDWPPPPHVCTALPLARPSGRPKKNRKRDAEEARTPTLFLRQKRPLKCGKCGFESHNRQTCKGPSAAQRAQRDIENAQMEIGVEPNICRGRDGRGMGGRGKKGQDNGPQSEASG